MASKVKKNRRRSVPAGICFNLTAIAEEAMRATEVRVTSTLGDRIGGLAIHIEEARIEKRAATERYEQAREESLKADEHLLQLEREFSKLTEDFANG